MGSAETSLGEVSAWFSHILLRSFALKLLCEYKCGCSTNILPHCCCELTWEMAVTYLQKKRKKKKNTEENEIKQSK